MGSAFARVNLHRKAKEFSALADEERKSSELSKFLFGEDLSEKVKEQIESNKITRHVVKAEDKNKGKSVDVSCRNSFSQRRKRVVRRPSYRKRNRKGTTVNRSMQTQSATKH